MGIPGKLFFVKNLRGQRTSLHLVEELSGPRPHSPEDPCSPSGPVPWGPLPRGQGKPEPLPGEPQPRRREGILRRSEESSPEVLKSFCPPPPLPPPPPLRSW
uniref:Uncharacterized protein n=1 Tax=Mus musculus TaxID=10090 RepID=Q8BYT7_MOUSE|nr:unnamed protein product [Mus musculus]